MIKMRRRKVIAGSVALAAALSFAAIFTWNAARWLNDPDPLVPADAIVVLAGGFLRPVEAGELFARGLAPVVYVSVPINDPAATVLSRLGIALPRKEETYVRTLLAMGVPREAVRFLGSGAISTFDEATAASRLFTREGTRLLVVTSPSHVRRARMIFRDALEERGIKVAVTGARSEPFLDRWWTAQDAAREVLLEWSKIAFYIAGGRFVHSGFQDGGHGGRP